MNNLDIHSLISYDDWVYTCTENRVYPIFRISSLYMAYVDFNRVKYRFLSNSLLSSLESDSVQVTLVS